MKQKRLNIIFSILMIAALLLGASSSVSAKPLAMPSSPVDESKVPHYFGPWPNWANSSYTMPDVAVTVDGDGVGAEAAATVGANGAVTSINITNPGSGYTFATFTFSGSGTGASADAMVSTTGVVASITVDPTQQGSGYIYPYVIISGGDGAGATATAYGGADLVDILLSTSVSGYTMPTVEFDLPDDPSGTPASGHALCLENNCVATAPATTVTVIGIHVDSAGSGYSTAPKAVIRDGTAANPINNRAATAAKEAKSKALKSNTAGSLASSGTDLAAAASAVLPSVQAPLHILYVLMDTFGAGYTVALPPTVTIADSAPVPGSGAVATPVIEVGAVTGFANLVGGSGYLTPGGIKKFQDGLPMLCDPSVGCTDNNLGQHLPLAVPDITTFPGADYYVIALVQTRERMNSSLPAQGTLLREYVQLETPDNASWSKHIQLQTANLDGTFTPIYWPGTTTPVLAVDNPHFLGPVIQAEKDRPVRLMFYNLLPTGADGNLFFPMDSTFMGAGMGPMMGMSDPVDQGSVLDMVRNPMCGEVMYDAMGMPMPKDPSCFMENRATLHLHGGITPWISDGSPHQWITPANEMTDWPEGVAVRQVPDMVGQAAVDAGIPDCSAANDGCMTFYYTNQQSARLMFYHDHAWGITRLNVYAGEAAGYIIRDATEKALIDGGLIPSGAAEIPLVIQDRTFVPNAAQMAQQDPTWDYSRWGSEGNLWYEHVYMPAQNPNDPSGLSTVGRWFYGPWFWPPASPTYPAIANPYYNMDPNGPDGIRYTADDWTTQLAMPCNLDNPATWQYDTDPFCEPPQIPGTPNNSAGMEQFNDTPIVNGTAYPTTTVDPKSYRFRILNAANDRFWNLQWYVADPTALADPLDPTSGTEVALNPAELAAAQTDPNIFPTPDTSVSPAGPSWIQIGTEGGFLPAPVVVPNQPITWIIDPTRFDVGNVDKHSLLLGPAERADVIVDFSKFAGKTLILYNDAPAAFPARISTYDYYTGAPDLSPAGAPAILPGYGPNTRTVMQVKVSATTPAPAFNLTALNNAFKHHVDGSGVFESGQAPTIVGQAGYNSAYGKSFSSGSWCNSPAAPAGTPCDGFARISEQGYDTFKFDTLSGSQIGVRIEPKAIHDETNSTNFEPFGRMTGNLGVEVVPAGPLTQNVVLYPFVNPVTEIFDGTNLPTTGNLTPISVGTDGTQIWKFTHNGVDTHPIHFHLYDVQLLNRVTWDNIIIPPDATELGWKDTVRVSPLEDTYFAIRPIIPTFPFELLNSIRPENPMMPAGDTTMFNNITPDGVGSIPIVNQLVNFGWEYMLHCHILSHEEMDMMRPVTVAMPPIAPDGLAYTVSNGNRLTLTWNDNSINETAFLVQKTTDGVNWIDVGTSTSPLDQPNVHGPRSLIDTKYSANTGFLYHVVALNTVGYGVDFPSMTVQSVSASIGVNAPAAPTNLTATLQAGPQVRLAWTDNAASETGFIVERSTDGVTFNQIATAPARNGTGSVTYTDTTALPGNTYTYRVAALNIAGTSGYSNTAQAVVPAMPAVPTSFTVANGPNGNGNSRTVNLTWTADTTNVTGFTIQRATNANFTGGSVNTVTVAPTATSLTQTGLSRNTTYYYRIRANNGSFVWSAWLTATPFPITTNP